MPKPKVTTLENNGKRIEFDIAADRVAIVMHSNLDFEDVVNKAVDALEAQNYQVLLKDAQDWYRGKFEAEEVDGSLSAWSKEAELITAFMTDGKYENAKTKADRIAQEEADRIAEKAAKEEKRLADLAQAEKAEGSALDDILQPV